MKKYNTDNGLDIEEEFDKILHFVLLDIIRKMTFKPVSTTLVLNEND